MVLVTKYSKEGLMDPEEKKGGPLEEGGVLIIWLPPPGQGGRSGILLSVLSFPLVLLGQQQTEGGDGAATAFVFVT